MTECARSAMMLDGETSKYVDILQGVAQECTLLPNQVRSGHVNNLNFYHLFQDKAEHETKDDKSFFFLLLFSLYRLQEEST